MPEEIRIIVAGSRTYSDSNYIYEKLNEYIKGKTKDAEEYKVTIISGGCRGVDAVGEQYAKDMGYELRVFNPEWEKYGRGSGPIRNEKMVEYAMDKDGVIIAFWNGRSAGTGSLIALGRAYGINTRIYKI